MVQIQKKEEMMKKSLFKVGLMIGLIVVVFGSVSAVYAASPAPRNPGDDPRNNNPQNQPQQNNYDRTELETIMWKYLAKSVGLGTNKLKSRMNSGESYVSIAMDQDYSYSEAKRFVTNARTKALKQGVKNGIITQVQANQLQASNFTPTGFQMGYANSNHNNGYTQFQMTPEMEAMMKKVMYEYLADQLGIKTSQLTKAMNSGETFVQITADEGFTSAQAQTFLANARNKTLAYAVKKGWISQNQTYQVQNTGFFSKNFGIW